MKIIQYSKQEKKNFILLITLIFISISTFAQHDSLQIRIDSLEWKLQLKEVSVVAKKNLFVRKIDRLVFNVENTVMSTSGDCLDALRITPGVQVQNNQITMIAKSSMTVMVDERIIPLNGESLINYLKTIPTATIKSIEVITTPPSKYDAAGNSGMINIVLKKAKNDSWNLAMRGAYTQAMYSGANVGADFNYKKNKLSVFSSISTARGTTYNSNEHTIYYPTETWISKIPFNQTNSYVDGNFCVDYEISSSWRMSGTYMGYLTNNGNKMNFSTSIYNDDNSLNRYLQSTGTESSIPNLHSANLHNIIKLDTLGKNISVDIDYFTYHNKDTANFNATSYYNDNTVIPNSLESKSSNNKQGLNNYSAKVDVELPYKWSTISFGVKSSFSQTENRYHLYNKNNGVALIDLTQSNTFRYTENMQAAYFSAKKTINKFDFQVGLRMENTISKGYSETVNQTNDTSYFQLFPTMYIVYRLKEDKSISFSYSRRINRPYFQELNPFRIYLSSLSYTEGNPFLQPSFSNNLELTMNTQSFEHKVFYSSFKNTYQQFAFVNKDTKVTRYFPLNFINYETFGISETYTFNKFWWWNSYNNAICYHTYNTATIPEAQHTMKKYSGNFTTNNDFMLNKSKTIMLNLGFVYSFPLIDGFTNIQAFNLFYGGVKVKLFDEKLLISIVGNDIFHTQYIKASFTSNGINNYYNLYQDNQKIELTVTYKFGNKLIQTNQHGAGNDEERGRIKN